MDPKMKKFSATPIPRVHFALSVSTPARLIHTASSLEGLIQSLDFPGVVGSSLSMTGSEKDGTHFHRTGIFAGFEVEFAGARPVSVALHFAHGISPFRVTWDHDNHTFAPADYLART